MSAINPVAYYNFLPVKRPRTIKDKLSLKNLRNHVIRAYCKLTQPKTVTIEGIKLYVSDNLQGHVLRAIHLGNYERAELATVEHQIEPSDVVMELGTGLGLLSSFCATKVGSDQVFTYEANPSLEPYIRDNYRLNNVDPKLNICMLGEQPGSQDFYVNSDFWASSTIRRSPEDQKIQIPVKSFNEEIRRINPSLLIIDIEGGEYELFKYADLHNVKKLCLELHNDVLGEERTNFILSKLADCGFMLDQELTRSRELFLKR